MELISLDAPWGSLQDDGARGPGVAGYSRFPVGLPHAPPRRRRSKRELEEIKLGWPPKAHPDWQHLVNWLQPLEDQVLGATSRVGTRIVDATADEFARHQELCSLLQRGGLDAVFDAHGFTPARRRAVAAGVHGRRDKDVAKEMGISPANVRDLRYQAIKDIRQRRYKNPT